MVILDQPVVIERGLFNPLLVIKNKTDFGHLLRKEDRAKVQQVAWVLDGGNYDVFLGGEVMENALFKDFSRDYKSIEVLGVIDSFEEDYDKSRLIDNLSSLSDRGPWHGKSPFDYSGVHFDVSKREGQYVPFYSEYFSSDGMYPCRDEFKEVWYLPKDIARRFVLSPKGPKNRTTPIDLTLITGSCFSSYFCQRCQSAWIAERVKRRSLAYMTSLI